MGLLLDTSVDELRQRTLGKGVVEAIASSCYTRTLQNGRYERCRVLRRHLVLRLVGLAHRQVPRAGLLDMAFGDVRSCTWLGQGAQPSYPVP